MWKTDPMINNQYWTKKRLLSILENGSIDQYLILNEKEATVHSWKWIHLSITNIEQKRGCRPFLKMDPSINNQYWTKKRLSSILENGSIYQYLILKLNVEVEDPGLLLDVHRGQRLRELGNFLLERLLRHGDVLVTLPVHVHVHLTKQMWK